MSPFFYNPWIWFLICLVCLLLCTYLPVKIKDPVHRKIASWVILVPVSLVLILYGYPVGIELFRRLAIHWN